MWRYIRYGSMVEIQGNQYLPPHHPWKRTRVARSETKSYRTKTRDISENRHISLLILFDTPRMEFLFDLPVHPCSRRCSHPFPDDSPPACSHHLLAKCLQRRTKSPVQVRRMKENSFLISKYSAVNPFRLLIYDIGFASLPPDFATDFGVWIRPNIFFGVSNPP